MKKRLMLAAALIATVFTTNTASAVQLALDNFNANYGTKVTECSLCHTSPPSLNFFGADFKANGGWLPGYMPNWALLDAADSDANGQPNGAQIGAGFSPADANITLASLSTGSTEKASVTGCLSGVGTSAMILAGLFLLALLARKKA